MTKCPVCGMMVDENIAPTTEYKGTKYYFHTPEHRVMFEKEPEKFLNRQNF
jgi:YHS domain-containing protein